MRQVATCRTFYLHFRFYWVEKRVASCNLPHVLLEFCAAIETRSRENRAAISKIIHNAMIRLGQVLPLSSQGTNPKIVPPQSK